MTIQQLALVGDSLTIGDAFNHNIAAGGKGCWAELVAEMLADIPSVGPLLSSGARFVAQGIVDSVEWSFAGSWTTVLSTDAFCKTPYRKGQYANGASNIATATLSLHWRPAVGFAIYWIDYTSGGNWSYSTDGGNTWTAMGQALANDNKLCKFYVSTPVRPGATVQIRAANAAGTGVGCLPAAIEWFYSTATSGLIVHNVAVGGTALHTLATADSGDQMAFLDSVKLGTGSPITNQPNAGCIVMHINDVAAVNNASTWNTDLGTFYSRASALGAVGILSPWECNGVAADQATYRAQTKTAVAPAGTAFGAKSLDIYDAWTARGYGIGVGTQNAALVAAAYLEDLTHPTQIAHLDLANRLYWFVRNQILALGAVPTAYPVGAKAAATTYTGGRAAVAYAAGAPIAIAA